MSDPQTVSSEAAWAAQLDAHAADHTHAVTPIELGSHLSARLCHDFISPASAIMSGLDLLEDPSAQDMRDDAMNLINASAKKLVAILAFSRVAFGASASAETFDTRDLERLTRGIFEHVRPDLAWSIDMPSLNKASARTLLNLAQLAAGALPTGGLAQLTGSIEGGQAVFGVNAAGARARLRPEVIAGLKGEPLSDGLGGHWVQAYYLHALLAAAGGKLDFAQGEETVTLRARVPLESGQ